MERIKYCLVILGIILPFLTFSQKKNKEAYKLLSLPKVVVDGDVREWENHFYNSESDVWHCALSLHDGKLYAVVVLKDPMLQNEAIRNGITLNLSYDSKKKEGAKLIFPVADRESIRALRQDENLDADRLRQDILNSARGYFVKGFNKVVDGLLSYHNEYGIKAIAKLDSNQLVYESVIPLDLIKFKTHDIAIQLAVNTQYMQLQKAASQQNQTNNNFRIYGIRPTEPTIKNPYKEKTVIWVKGSIK